MNTYIIGFRQKGNRNGRIIREETIVAESAAQAIEGTYSDRVARSETWKAIFKRDDAGVFQLVTTIDQYRASLGDIDLWAV